MTKQVTNSETIIGIEIRCYHCNRKLSEIYAPAVLMVQEIKCPRCGEITANYVIKPLVENDKPHKPNETPKFEVPETKRKLPREKYFKLDRK